MSKTKRGSGRRTLALASLTTVALSLALIAGTNAGAAPSVQPHSRSHIGGVVPTRDHARPRSPQAGNLVYHGGKVMRKKNVAYAIFWEPTNLQNGDPTHVSATYNSLLQRYFGDFGGSGLYNTATQYYQVVNGKTQHIKNNSSLGGAWVDTAPYPASGCNDSATPGNCLNDGQIQAEVAHAMSVNGWKGGLQHQFFVFTSYGEGSCFSQNSSTCAFTYYCAYHGDFTRNGKPVIYANMPYTGTSLSACGVDTTPNNDIDADSTINVTSHEQREAVNDPELDAWYDSSGNEGSDKCAWNFGPVNLDGGKANEQWNGNFYIVQQEWSNDGSHCVQTYP